jgi:hypothetical protein
MKHLEMRAPNMPGVISGFFAIENRLWLIRAIGDQEKPPKRK